MDTTAKPNGYGFGPAGRAFGGPLRLWNPAWMGIFGGPSTPTVGDATGQALYVELTSTWLGTYGSGAKLTALQARPTGTLPAQGCFYAIGAGNFLVEPDDNNAYFPPQFYMYAASGNADPGSGNRNAAAFQTGKTAEVVPTNATWISRIDIPDYWNMLGLYYTSTLAGVPNSGAYQSTGFAQGILPDVMGTYPARAYCNNLNQGQFGTGVATDPWNFDTNAHGMYTPSRWMDFIIDGLGALKVALGGSNNVGFNGLNDGVAYFGEPTSRLLAAADYGMAEEWLRGSNALASPTAFSQSEADWQKQVDMLYDAAVTLGKSVFVCSKLWPSGTPATIAQSKQWFTYLLGSFLLGNANTQSCGKHFWHYRHDNPNVAYVAGTDGDGSGDDMKGRHNWRPDINFYGGASWYDAVNCLGANVTNVNYPTQGVASLKRVDTYVAQFQNGYVLVNPSTTNAAASRLTLPVPASGQWKTFDGTPISGVVPAVPARSAVIITNPTAVSGPGTWDNPTTTWDSVTIAWDGAAYVASTKRGVLVASGAGTVAFGGKVKTHGIFRPTGQGIFQLTGSTAGGISADFLGRGTLVVTGKRKTRGRMIATGTGSMIARAAAGVITPTVDRNFRIGKTSGGSRIGGQDRLGGQSELVGPPAVQFHIGGATASRIGGENKIGGLSHFVASTVSGAVDLVGSGALAARGKLHTFGRTLLSGAGALALVGKHKGRGAAPMTGGGAALFHGHRRLKGRMVASGAGSAAFQATRKVRGRTTPAGAGTLVARGNVPGRVSADLEGAGSLALSGGHLTIHGRATMAGAGSLTARSTLSRGHVVMVGVGTLTAGGRANQFAHVDLTGGGSSTFDGTLLEEGHGADFGPTRAFAGVGASHTTGDFLGEHDDP